MAKLAILSSLVVTLSMIIAATATAQSAESVPEPVIPAQVDRRDVHSPKIGSSEMEGGAYTGSLSVQDFGTKSSFGFGTRALPVDSFSMRLEIPDNMSTSDLLAKHELKHTLELTLGLAAYF